MRSSQPSKIAPATGIPVEVESPAHKSGGRKRNQEFEIAFSARIRAARVAAKMSQGALGKAIGVSFQQVQKYELGKDRISVGALQAIAAVLGVHPGSFFDGDVPMPEASIMELRATTRIGERIQRIRDPDVAKRLLTLADAIASVESDAGS